MATTMRMRMRMRMRVGMRVSLCGSGRRRTAVNAGANSDCFGAKRRGCVQVMGAAASDAKPRRKGKGGSSSSSNNRRRRGGGGDFDVIIEEHAGDQGSAAAAADVNNRQQYWEHSHLMVAWDDAFTFVSVDDMGTVEEIIATAQRGIERVGRGVVLVTVTAELAQTNRPGSGFGASRGRLPSTNLTADDTHPSSSKLIRPIGVRVRYVPRCFITESNHDISMLYPQGDKVPDISGDEDDAVMTAGQLEAVAEIRSAMDNSTEDGSLEWLCVTNEEIDEAIGINDRARLISSTAPVVKAHPTKKPWRRHAKRPGTATSDAVGGPCDDPYVPEKGELVLCLVLRVVAHGAPSKGRDGETQLRYKTVGGDVVVTVEHEGRTVLMERVRFDYLHTERIDLEKMNSEPELCPQRELMDLEVVATASIRNSHLHSSFSFPIQALAEMEDPLERERLLSSRKDDVDFHGKVV